MADVEWEVGSAMFSAASIRRCFKDNTGYASDWIRGNSSYQKRRTEGTRQRWQMLGSRLDDEDKSLLDVGSDIGMLTEAAARNGLVAIGIEQRPGRVRQAAARCKGQEGLAFMVLTLTPDNIENLPKFDVILCLSIYHQWVRLYGTEVACRMLCDLGRKAARKLYFEPASLTEMYGGFSVGFEDGNELSIRYYLELLGKLFPRAVSVSYLGTTVCRESEPFRLLFEVAMAS